MCNIGDSEKINFSFFLNRLDPTKFSEGLRILLKNNATSQQIEDFKQRCEETDVSCGLGTQYSFLCFTKRSSFNVCIIHKNLLVLTESD